MNSPQQENTLMRTAVLSDIHSNYYAFRTCCTDAIKHGADSFIFLGDYISDLAEPGRCMDLVYAIQAEYHMRDIFNLSGIVRPAILVHGEVAGWWNLKNRVLTVNLFGNSHTEMIRETADSLWHDLKRINIINTGG